MPLAPCTQPGCPNPATHRGRCTHHQTADTQQRNHTRGLQRRVYLSKRWQTTRLRQLHHQPLCNRCGRIAQDVHHKQDLADGGDPWNPDNLESLCRPCHSRHSRANIATITA